MPIALTGQAPAPGALDHDPAAFYQLTFEVTPVADDFLLRVSFDAGGGAAIVLDFSTPPAVLNFAPGWEGAVNIVGTTVIVTFRPVGGWTPGANYGAGGGALVGRITEVRLAGEPGLFVDVPPAFDFATAAAEQVEDVPVSGRPFVFPASAWWTASGLLTLRKRVQGVTRTGPGVYVVELELGFARHLTEYHPRAVPLAALPRIATVTEGPGAASWTVRVYDAAGQPADANIGLAVNRRAA